MGKVPEGLALAEQWQSLRSEQVMMSLQCPIVATVSNYYGVILLLIRAETNDVSYRHELTLIRIYTAVIEDVWSTYGPQADITLRSLDGLANYLFLTRLEESFVISTALINLCDVFCVPRRAGVAIRLGFMSMAIGFKPEHIRNFLVAIPSYIPSRIGGY